MKRTTQILIMITLISFGGPPFWLNSHAKEAVVLHTVHISGNYRDVLAEIVWKFNQENKEIQLNYAVKENEEFHEERAACLKNPHCPVDIYLGFAGYNFEQTVMKGRIEPLEDLWEQERLDRYFTNIKDSMNVQGKPYGLPLSYYPWGFFYKKSLFDRLQITPPQSWDEFLEVCEIFKAANVIPILTGTKQPFPAASWFSYLNLRLHGLEFHTQLTAGKIPYTDSRVQKTFEFWKDLIDRDYFNKDSHQLKFKQVPPFLYREIGGMYLMGNIILSSIPDEIRPDIGFFRFPKINPSLPWHEEAPLDLLFIPKQSKHKNAAKKVLAFLARPEILYQYNKAAGYLSPNTASRKSDDRLLQVTADHLKSGEGFSYFFNRNSPPEMGRPGTKLLGRFVTEPNIEYTIQEFEKLRASIGKGTN